MQLVLYNFREDIKFATKRYYLCPKPWNALTVMNKNVFTLPEAMVIKSLVSGVFSGKNKTPALVKNPFYSLQTQLGTYVNLYSFERLMTEAFPGFFFLQGKQKSPITNHAKPTLCKECNQKC